jgi:hypothetical protein
VTGKDESVALRIHFPPLQATIAPVSLRTLYLDTLVVGGYFDKEYQKETRQLWDLWKTGRYRFVSSVVVEEEIEPAPEPVRRLYAKTFPDKNRLARQSVAGLRFRPYSKSIGVDLCTLK